MRKIEISEEEFQDRMAVECVKVKHQNGTEPVVDKTELFKRLYDIHDAMYPLHDVAMRTEDEVLRGRLMKYILELNGLRAKLKNDSRTYAK